ncbi:hypothetical protein [Euzebya rosea]|uniref:hypothetical protein n=1 Tax=Euzebya rosea TaxID=2052804 RepID=UPI000D3EC69D|nr:hypothetical protein [Euzebya rosea]
MTGVRNGVLAAVLLVLLAGCLPEVPAPVVVQTMAPGQDDILLARDALGEDVVAVARLIIAAPSRLEELRFEVERGAPQRAVQEALRQHAADLMADSDALLADAAALRAEVGPDPLGPVAHAAAMAAELGELGRVTAGEITRDVDSLTPVIAFDTALDDLVEAWNVRGSRSQQVERFELLVAEADGLVSAARRLDVGDCTLLRTNRIRWAELLAVRTAALRDAALERAGTRFDELRDQFSRAPLGEDRAVADSETMACWARGSSVEDRGEQAQALVDGIRSELG